MKNTDFLKEYDIIVTYTQAMINQQLGALTLTHPPTIDPTLIIVQSLTKDGSDYEYEQLKSGDQIPKNCAYINCKKYYPSILINEDSQDVTLLLNFQSGNACFWEGLPPNMSLKEYDMSGWTYGIDISLNLAELAAEDINKKIKVPKILSDQLNHFIDNMFRIDHLFLDFESVDLMKFNTSKTNAGTAGDRGVQELVTFMQFYLKNLQKEGNPFILGYTTSSDDSTKYDPESAVPDTLKPVGTTFKLYQDAANNDLSNLNFLIATKGGKGKVQQSPDGFDTNWFSANDQATAKMIISGNDLLESFILKPFFNNLRNQLYNGIHQHLSITENNTYENAKKLNPKSNGWTYTISNVTSGDNQYVNIFSVIIDNTDGKLILEFEGHIRIKKIVKKKVIKTYHPYSESEVIWVATITLKSIKNNDKNVLEYDVLTPKPFSHNKTHIPKGLKAIKDILKILGAIGDAFEMILTLGKSGGFFHDLFLKSFDIKGLNGINTKDLFTNLSSMSSSYIMLPAGDTFQFKNPSSDMDFTLYLDLSLPGN